MCLFIDLLVNGSKEKKNRKKISDVYNLPKSVVKCSLFADSRLLTVLGWLTRVQIFNHGIFTGVKVGCSSILIMQLCYLFNDAFDEITIGLEHPCAYLRVLTSYLPICANEECKKITHLCGNKLKNRELSASNHDEFGFSSFGVPIRLCLNYQNILVTCLFAVPDAFLHC